VERKSVNKFFREQMENRFMLNKDPDSVNVLVDNMKKDFHKNARDGMTPNRVIFFSGASQFYKTLYSTPQGQYWCVSCPHIPGSCTSSTLLMSIPCDLNL
jgi:hypothetical protein